PHFNDQDITSEEKLKRETEYQEKALVEKILTEAANWYHKQLENYTDIKNHLLNHYGFSENIIEELQIGFAPAIQGSSQLADHLNKISEFQGKLALSGLFSFGSPDSPLFDFFKGRIIFPYWKSGKVVYMAARATNLTPVDKYECYPDKNGDIQKDNQENPSYIKYKKLRTHDPNDEKKKYISKFIQNESFMGEDSIRGADEIIITEGAPDWVSAVDKGFAAISPITTSFREKDIEKLESLTRNAKSIYIINDNEENQAGLNGALKTGKHLTKVGRNVFLVELPRAEEINKIDLNEYFKDHTANDLRVLMEKAKSILEIMIDELPANFLKAAPLIKEDIAPILCETEKYTKEYYINIISKKINSIKKPISAIIESVRQEKLLQESKNKKEEIKIDPEIEKESIAIAKDPLLFKKRIDTVNRAGVIGERGTIAMYMCALDSRLLPENPSSPNILAVKNSGHFGAGKSYTLENCLIIYPESAYHKMTSGSPKSLYYLQEGLKHKALIVAEGFQFQTNNASDSEFVYVARSLISEGRINYSVVVKNDEGKQITEDISIEGPTSFITTTIMDKLEAQFDDRLFTVHPDESIDQTKDIIGMTANQKAGQFEGLDQKTINLWKMYHESLKPVEVIIPFAPEIAKFINKTKVIPISTRRAFKRVLIVIQTVACSYQYQRARDDKNRIIAEIADYWMALQIVQDAFKENMGKQSKKTEEYLAKIRTKGSVSQKELAEKFGVSKQIISSWTKKQIEEGILTWCQENGNSFTDEKDLKKAKHSGKAFLTIMDDHTSLDTSGLPTPYDLTNDLRWDEGGEMLVKYDLNLNGKAGISQVSSGCQVGVNQVSAPILDTYNKDQGVDNIKYLNDKDMGVNVSIPEERIYEKLEIDDEDEEEIIDSENEGGWFGAVENYW
ncbi:MAG: primase, partial [Euryarchaeota archaeon]|nr:primase [Euryarchaeota archaeon]